MRATVQRVRWLPRRSCTRQRVGLFVVVPMAAVLLSGCFTPRFVNRPPPKVYERETFSAASGFSREFVASPTDTCNAARRALLSQGYIVATSSNAEQVQAHKRFQTEGESHVQIEFNVVCASSAKTQPTTAMFVSAVQDRYELKKSSTSASVGVAPFGSISVPVSQSSEALVKVASETIPAGPFYERFFDLTETVLAEQKGLD
jgi:hypothetical protein